MQYRVYDRTTLKYRTGGYVVSYSIDDDYIVNNNSTITVVKNDRVPEEYSLSSVVVGDIIVLIQDSGAFHKGVITTVDDTALSITYKSDKELFNDNMINPFREEFVGDTTVTVVGKFGIEAVIAVFNNLFAKTTDPYKKLPITFISNGDVLDDDGNVKMLWTWSDDQINLVDWLVELFEKYNLTMEFTIDFNTAEETLEKRTASYIVTFSAITNSGGIIKDNVDMQTITYTSKELPDATVCYVINSTDKSIVLLSEGRNLINPQNITENKELAYNADFGTYVESTSEHTNITDYIAVKQNTDYVLSLKGEMPNPLYILCYNKDKKPIGYLQYKLDENDPYLVFNTNMGGDLHTTGDNTPKDIAYIRITYYNADAYGDIHDIQFEQGSVPTEYDPYTIPAIYYLYEKDGVYSISTDIDNTSKNRVLPVKTVVASYNENSSSGEIVTPEEAAEDKLVPNQFNQAIEIRINKDSKMFDFTNARFGDLYKIINEYGTIDSVYTGKKFTNNDKWVMLYFGLGRQNYTDLIQIRLRKNKYTELYNQG